MEPQIRSYKNTFYSRDYFTDQSVHLILEMVCMYDLCITKFMKQQVHTISSILSLIFIIRKESPKQGLSINMTVNISDYYSANIL